MLDTSLEADLRLAARFGEASTPPNVRRHFNPGVLEGELIDVEGSGSTRLAQPFKLLDKDFLARLDQEWKNPGHSQDRGSNMELFGGGDGTRTHEPLDCQSSALPAELRPRARRNDISLAARGWPALGAGITGVAAGPP